MIEDTSLEGWAPVIGDGVTLEDVVDRAFDYRGDVTVVRRDGSSLVGYVYNRDRHAPEPSLQLFDPDEASHTVRYADIRTIAFTGKDPAAGKSFEAWLRRKGEAPGA
ncbi:MAG: hypothetical protein HYS77_14085 [Candidatus Rokubacteria bacterium]|nr:hypothetical protein [Candidatus Rokubacteria bacterium]MBI4246371.1 hypothetical protein [Candidatus Rokubacteria bacterium]